MEVLIELTSSGGEVIEFNARKIIDDDQKKGYNKESKNIKEELTVREFVVEISEHYYTGI